MPDNCGIPAATLKKLVPEPRPGHVPATCSWSSDDGPDLAVDLTKWRVTIRDSDGPDTPRALAVKHFASLRDGLRSPQRVTGLGDAAWIEDGDYRSTLVFRAGNLAAEVRGYDLHRAGLLRAAAEIAGAMGGKHANPRVVDPRPAPPRNPPGKVCALVTNRFLTSVSADAAEADEITSKATEDGHCTWRFGERTLEVGVHTPLKGQHRAIPLRAGDAYLVRHYNARAELPITRAGDRVFTALKGLGQRAFALYTEDTVPGRVVFLDGNQVVTVEYEGDAEPLPHTEALTDLHRVAGHVQTALAHP